MMLQGLARRQLFSMQEAAQLYIWIKSLVTNKGARKVDQIVRDPDTRTIYASDFDSPEDFQRALKDNFRGSF